VSREELAAVFDSFEKMHKDNAGVSINRSPAIGGGRGGGGNAMGTADRQVLTDVQQIATILGRLKRLSGVGPTEVSGWWGKGQCCAGGHK